MASDGRARTVGRMADRWWRRIAGQPEDESWQDQWLYRIASSVLMLQHLIVIVCGLAWIKSPSGSIDRALDPAWSGGWSLMFVVFAIVGLVARLRRAWLIEAAANIIIAISVWLWAMVILVVTVAGSYGGLQTGLMLLAFAASLWGWSLVQIAWMRRRESEGARLRRAVAAYLAQEKAAGRG